MSNPQFLHVDLDAFFASVEQLDNPEYRNKPVIVGSLPTDKRGVVSTCSYEARKFGIHSAMPIFQAYKLCPQGIFLRGRMKRYQEKSQEVMQIFCNYSPDVQQMSVDEAFIDITGTEKLFGNPIDTAKRLQQEVFDKTGLTVSIGLASNKYIAKIASDIKKPNGIYYIKNGDEESFMLSLPLNKIWGLGNKTLEKLKKAGINSTQLLHAASENMLAGIVGSTTAHFLANAVRGNITEKFNTKAKSHSISSERTFPVDVKDPYILETTLMDLSYEIFFRMMKKGWNSKTAAIKIRYEDFTTLTAQITTDRCFLSTDDFYSRVVSLFHKKHEKDRGIRLIGCGAQNLESSDIPQQAELFDFGDEKKRKIENTIMHIQSKDSNIKIQKARLLTKNPARRHNFAFIFALFIPVCTFFTPSPTSLQSKSSLYAIDFPKELEAEDPESLYEISSDDENVEFFAEGEWDTSLTASSTISKDSDDDSVSFEQDSFVLDTDVDLTAWFFLFKTWYFEANVADDFDNNTVAAGYYGDGFLKHARIGNRYIDFPDTYGISDVGYGSSDNSSQMPGFMTEWSGDDWQANSIIRYDKIESYEKEWVGQNEVTETTIGLDEYNGSLRFELPEEAFDNIFELLLEVDEDTDESDVDYVDEDGKYYEIISSDDYMLLPSINSIVFKNAQTGNILVRFFTSYSDDTLKGDLGGWDDSSSFLGTIQTTFDEGLDKEGIQVDFTELCGGETSDTNLEYLFVNTGSTSDSSSDIASSESWALYLQRSGCFSPFADYSLYKTSSGETAESVTVQYESSESTSSDFAAKTLENSSLFGGTFTDTDFFGDSFTVIQVYSVDDVLLDRYPLAQTNPSVYVSDEPLTDLELSLETYSSVDELNIGTNVTTSSIEVYRNGIKEQNFIYDSDDGTVTLSPNPSDVDTILIKWSEYDDDADTGLLTVAVGFKKTVSTFFDYNISGSFFYPILEDTDYFTLDDTTSLSATLAFNTNLHTDSLSLNNTIAGTLKENNISGNLRVFSMNDDEPITLYLDSDPIIDDASQSIEASVSRSETTTGYELTLTTNFTDESITEENKGTAYQSFQFADSSSSIATAQEFIIQLEGLDGDCFAYDETNEPDCKAYLQLGVSDTGEVTSLSPKRYLDPNNQDLYVDSTYTITLSDVDRARIDDNTCARIIIESSTEEGNEESPLIIQTCSVTQVSFAANCPDGYSSVKTKEILPPSSAGTQLAEMLTFNTDSTNYVQEISWSGDSSIDDDTDITEITAVKYTDSIPFSEYSTLNFFAYFDSDENYTITFSFDRPDTDDTDNAITLTLYPDAVSKFEDNWQKCSFDMVNKTLSINDVTIDESLFSYSIDSDVSPTCLTIEILQTDDYGDAQTLAEASGNSGSLYIDEIYFSETQLEAKITDILALSWAQQKDFTNSSGFIFAQDTSLDINSEGSISNGDQYSTETSAIIETDATAETTIPLLDISTSINSLFDADTTTLEFTGLGYSLKTNNLNFEKSILFNILSGEDSTNFSTNYVALEGTRSSKAQIQLSKIGIPLTLSSSASATTDTTSAEQDFSSSIRLNPIFTYLMPTLYIKGSASQSLDSPVCSQFDSITTNAFTSSWGNLSNLQFSTGDTDASNKEISLNSTLTVVIPAISVTPVLSFDASNNDTTDENIAYNTMTFEIPFSINMQGFQISFKKKCTTTTDASENTTYFTNYYDWYNSLPYQKSFWIAYPFAGLYNQILAEELMETCLTNEDIQTNTTVSSVGFSWKRPIFASVLDFFIPSSASIALERDVQASSSDYTDIYQTSVGIAGTAFNCFGTIGSHTLFSWYEEDEFINSASATFKFEDTITTEIELYSQTNIYIKNDDMLSFTLESDFDTDDSDSLELSATYTWNKPDCFITDLVMQFKPEFLDESKNAEREESFSYELNNDSDDEKEHSISLSHILTASITDFLDIYTSIEETILLATDSFELTNTISIGGDINF
ncbi:MAG: hypothetical protein BKP49_01045 [Treponema sp. CETP13]|nr:MAG: hypothetical protein BKP49_01045 [Treponema sp. CETP13]